MKLLTTTLIALLTVFGSVSPLFSLNCPPSITLNTEPDLCEQIAAFTIPASMIFTATSDDYDLYINFTAGSPAPDNLPMDISYPENSVPPMYSATFFKGQTQVTLTYSDGQIEESCSFTITVNDNEAPELTCPMNIIEDNNPGECKANVAWMPATATDNCAVSSTPTSNIQPGSAFPVGTMTTVTYNVTDDAGNPAMCSFTVSVNDTEAPVFQDCPTDITASTNLGQCGANVDFMLPTVLDNCPMPSSPSADAQPGDFFNLGTTTVTVTATDMAGNPAENCVFTITVNDTELPTLTCPNNIVQANDIGDCGAVVTFSAMAADNCVGVGTPTSMPASGSFFPLGTTEVTFNVMDAAGNVAMPCTFEVTINDDEMPTLTCPNNIVQANDMGDCGAIVTFSAMAADNCVGLGTPTSMPASGSFFPLGTTEVTFNVMDAAGNVAMPCTFEVSIFDNQAPELFCPDDIVVDNAPGQCGRMVHFDTPTANDNCAASDFVVADILSGSFFEVGTTTVTFSVLDDANNPSTCSFDITVIDNEAPQMFCPNYIAVANDLGQCGAIVDFDTPIATDNCPMLETVISDIPSGSFFEIGFSLVTFSVTDNHGNSKSCQLGITVEDQEAPVILQCPGDVTAIVSESFDCQALIILDGLPIAATDNCGYTISQNGIELYPVGNHEVIWTVTDAVGHTDECVQTISVRDLTPPEIDCPSALTYTASDGCSIAASELLEPIATDECGIASITTDAPEQIGVGLTEISWTAVDVSGNAASCLQTITVVADSPTLNCPDNQSIAIETGSLGTPAFWEAPALEENCGFYLSSTHQSGDFFEHGVTEVRYFLHSQDGQILADCDFTICVYDPLAVDCTNDIQAVIKPGLSSETVTWNIPAAVSECPECKEQEIQDFLYLGTFEGHRYYLSENKATWQTAQQISANHLSYLAVISSPKENKFLADLLPEDHAFIGLNDQEVEGQLSWVNEESFDFNQLATNFNNSNTRDFGILSSTGEWTLVTDFQRYFIMEKPCVDIELLTPPLSHELNIGHYAVGYRYTSICGTEEDCYFNIQVENPPAVDYCETGVLSSPVFWRDSRFWIEELRWASDIHFSGDDEGYGDYSQHLLNTYAGVSTSFTIIPNQWNDDIPYFVNIWIDLNNDGDFFDEHELLLTERLDQWAIQHLSVPITVASGLYRMRVVLSNRDSVAPCGAFEQGEAEDYTVYLNNVSFQDDGTGRLSAKPQLAPNPARAYTSLRLPFAVPAGSYYEIYNLNGQRVLRKFIPANSKQSLRVSLTSLGILDGYYQVRVVVPGKKAMVLPLVVKDLEGVDWK